MLTNVNMLPGNGVALLSLPQLLLHIVGLLMLGHLCLSDLVNPAIGYPIGFTVILFLLIRLLFRRNYLDYVLIIFACSHFYYGNNHGGLWNYVNVMALLVYSFVEPWWEGTSNMSPFQKTVLGGLFLFNVLGLVFVAESSLAGRIEGFIISLSYGLLFLFILRLPATTLLFSRLLLVVAGVGLWSLVIALSQKTHFLESVSPLLPKGNGDGLENNGWETYENKSERADGPFKDFELFAEYASLLYAVFFPILIGQVSRYFRLKAIIPALAVIGSFLCVLMTATRSSILLLIPVTFFYLLYYRSQFIRKPALLAAIGAFIGFIVLIGPYIGLDYLLERLGELDVNRLSSGSAKSAEAINRGETYQAGLERLMDKDWLIGYGYGVSEHYSMAFFGIPNSEMRDYHNLYLSLPITLGWIGTGLFILLLLDHAFQTLIACRSATQPHLEALVLGMAVFWGVFFINEFKIQAIREPNYLMLVWCWLGFSMQANWLASSSVKNESKLKSVVRPEPAFQSL
ncbi:O-antigen ligase domain-containing protein [Larkinella punicea]|uniref:O-antigen ligase domain-containing protein n=2 Tax=Larkinella punicea TaxID=2315727 RepID=A0A368JU35_9BACT|nr:O-antigen ligase domain-containing protein [Larkinella punicea]